MGIKYFPKTLTASASGLSAFSECFGAGLISLNATETELLSGQQQPNKSSLF